MTGPTLCLLWTLSTTVRARAAMDGKMARQAASRAVSHTNGLAKAFSKTPDDNKKMINNSKTYSPRVGQELFWSRAGEYQ